MFIKFFYYFARILFQINSYLSSNYLSLITKDMCWVCWKCIEKSSYLWKLDDYGLIFLSFLYTVKYFAPIFFVFIVDKFIGYQYFFSISTFIKFFNKGQESLGFFIFWIFLLVHCHIHFTLKVIYFVMD